MASGGSNMSGSASSPKKIAFITGITGQVRYVLLKGAFYGNVDLNIMPSYLK